MHEGEVHFDLLIHKDSDLAKEGCVDEMFVSKKVDDEKEKGDVSTENLGPGYIGWNTKDVQDDVDDDISFKTQIADLKEGMAAMKREFEELKLDVNKQEKKQFGKMKSELNGLKEDYIKISEDLRKETQARNEAETLVTVLKATFEAKTKIEESKSIEEMDVEERSEDIDGDEGQWNQQRQQRRKTKKRVRTESGSGQENESFSCDLCTNKFESESDLLDHKQTHVWYNCTQCDKKFLCKSELKQHVRVHIEKNVKCQQCDKTFLEETDLRNHKHDLVKCQFCSMVFQSEMDLIVHKETHTIFECNLCDYKFGKDADLVRHVKTHVVSRFNCDQCDEMFLDETAVSNHKQIHIPQSGSTEFNCNKCEKTIMT